MYVPCVMSLMMLEHFCDFEACLLNDPCGYWDILLSDAELMCLMMLKHLSDVFLKFSYIWYAFEILLY